MLLRHLDVLNNNDMTSINVKYNIATVAQLDGANNFNREDFIVNTTAFAYAKVDMLFIPTDLDLKHSFIRSALESQISLRGNEIIQDFYIVGW